MRNINGSRVAVVGGAGFLGSHCVEHLVRDRRCEVLVLDNLVAGKRQWIEDIAKFMYCDITDSYETLRLAFKKYQIQYVLNYAAFPYVPDSYSKPMRVCEVNFSGAVNVINAAQEAGVKAILQISSAEIYGDGYHMNVVPNGLEPRVNCQNISEDCPLIPHSSYGVTKAAVDSYIQVRWREAQTPCIALRQFNCVGERETHPYVIPEIISQLHEQAKLRATLVPMVEWPTTVRLGNNSARDFLYAGDQARMAVELLEKGQFGEAYNLGSESSVRIYDLAKIIGGVMGFGDVRVREEESRKRAWEIWSLKSSNAKIYSVIESRPKVMLTESIKKTVDWFRSAGYKWPWQN